MPISSSTTWPTSRAQRPDLDYPGQRVLSQYAANTAYFERQRLFGSLGENLLAARDFHPAGCIQDYLNVQQVQTLRLCGGGADPGLPDLNDHDRVVAAQRAYLLALKQVGVTGFRIDAAKHMGEKHLARVLEGVVDDGDLVFGELITGGGAGDREYALFLQPWLARTGWAAYDFPLHAMLRRGFAFGGDLSILADPLASGQALPDARAVTFAVTHDIPTTRVSAAFCSTRSTRRWPMPTCSAAGAARRWSTATTTRAATGAGWTPTAATT
jgi:alpha-amylase